MVVDIQDVGCSSNEGPISAVNLDPLPRRSLSTLPLVMWRDLNGHITRIPGI